MQVDYKGPIKLLLTAFSAALFLQGCAATEVTRLSANRFLLSASAAPACGRLGASRVAQKMAAVEVIRRGYQRYVILDAASANNVSNVYITPSGARATPTYGGGYQITYTGGHNITTGTNDADLHVLMLKHGDQGFLNGINPKSVLGEDWEKLVKTGINTCRE